MKRNNLHNVSGRTLKGQISIELIVVVGVVLAIFIPLLVTVYFKGLDMGEQLTVAQSRLAVTRLASLTNSVGNLGENAHSSIDLFIPEKMDSISFKNAVAGPGAEIVITLKTSEGLNEISEPVKFKFADEKTFSGLSRGTLKLTISSDGKFVDIEK